MLRAAIQISAVVGLLVLSGITVQARAEQSEREAHLPPGQLVAIGGGQLIHVRTWGDSNPGTTIVLDISAATPSSLWAWVGRALGEHHRVVAFDRPGMAWSAGPWAPRDAQHAADALASALTAAGIPPPYVVVGHSYGGFSSRVFAGMYRDRVSGLALLDTTHPGGGGEIGFATFYRLRAWQGHLGMFQFFPPPNHFSELPPEEQASAHAVNTWASHLDTSAEELEAWPTSAAQVRAIGSNFGDLPLLVVSGVGSPTQIDTQRDLARLSSNSRFVEIDADHMGMLASRGQSELLLEHLEQFIDSL